MTKLAARDSYDPTAERKSGNGTSVRAKTNKTLQPFGSILVGLIASAFVAGVACGQSPGDGFGWVTIGSAANAGYDGPSPFGRDYTGRGRVDYDYRIARNELTSAQWAEFVNTFSVQPDFPTTLFGRSSFTRGGGLWGGRQDPNYTGPGVRYITNGAGFNHDLRPVFGISWREAAMYANWMHHGRSSDPATLWGGAYDTSTWNNHPASQFTDQLAHEPGARFWIPTLDEWMKASFYDPNRHGAGIGGWWRYCNTSDNPPVPGLPGVPGATTSAGIDIPDLTVFDLPLGSYPSALSPWGLLDTSSGAAEWLEDNFSVVGLRERGVGGSWAGDLHYDVQAHAAGYSGRYLATGSLTSLRLASIVPSPGSGLLVGLVFFGRRRR